MTTASTTTTATTTTPTTAIVTAENISVLRTYVACGLFQLWNLFKQKNIQNISVSSQISIHHTSE